MTSCVHRSFLNTDSLSLISMPSFRGVVVVPVKTVFLQQPCVSILLHQDDEPEDPYLIIRNIHKSAIKNKEKLLPFIQPDIINAY